MNLDVAIYITIGDGCLIGLSDDNHLIIARTKNNVVIDRIDLGPYSTRYCEMFKGFLDQLAIHVKDKHAEQEGSTTSDHASPLPNAERADRRSHASVQPTQTDDHCP